MAKTAIKYDLNTGETRGIVQVSVDSDLDLNIGPGEGLIELQPDHPVLGEQNNWEIKAGNLQRKPQEEIDAREQAKKQSEEQRIKDAEEKRVAPLLVLLNGLNEVRAKQGLSLLDTKLVIEYRK